MARRLVQRALPDWEAVAQRIGHESLAPLLYAITRGQDVFPPALEARLQEAYMANASRNTLLLAELAQLLKQLAGAGVPVLVLKGAALAQHVYGNIAVRPMDDLDILVREEDARATVQLLAANGYERAAPEVHEGMALAYENEVLLVKRAAVDILLEPHWHLLDSPYHQARMEMDWYWETAVGARFEQASGLVLGPEALLLHLCAHLALHHGGDWLLWQHDVAEVLHAYAARLAWDKLLRQAAAADLVLPLQQIVPRVADQWLVTLPPAARAQLAALQPSAGELRVFGGMAAGERRLVGRFWGELVSIPSWRRRWRYATRNLFPSAEYMRQRYGVRHRALLPLYYVYRWYHGARRRV